jgi:hypothetical protein
MHSILIAQAVPSKPIGDIPRAVTQRMEEEAAAQSHL